MDEDMVLPCGCRMYTVDNTFVFQPHALECPWYAYVLQQAEENNTPTTTLEL